MQITIPRWAQLIVIPLVVLLGIYFSRMVSHALFVFLMAALLALLLNPLARLMTRVRIPRAVGVPVLYLAMLAVVGVIFAVAIPPLARQMRNLVDRIPEWADTINAEIPNYEAYLERFGMNVDLTAVFNRVGEWLGNTGLESTGRLVTLGVGLAGSIASLLLVLIVSFYMLIDGRRISTGLAKLLPMDEVTAEVYFRGLQTSFTRFVKGQVILAFSVGLAAGLGVWILGWDVVGIWPEGAQYALLFGVWAGITEVIPYVGPWLGAFPPVILALFRSPVTALWVALIFWAIQLLENHILVPNIMGASVRVHPLVVIFALLAGAEVGGVLGMLAVLPLLAMLRHTLDFFDIRLSRAPWIGDDGVQSVIEESASVASDGPASSQAATSEALSAPVAPDRADATVSSGDARDR